MNQEVVMSIKTVYQNKRFVVIMGALYLGILMGVVIAGAVIFHNLYELKQPNEAYRWFIRIASMGLGLYLAVWAALFGGWRRNVWHGLVAFGLGVLLTLAALNFLPWIYFPHDRYAAPAAWLMSSGPLTFVIWAILTLLTRLTLKRDSVA